MYDGIGSVARMRLNVDGRGFSDLIMSIKGPNRLTLTMVSDKDRAP